MTYEDRERERIQTERAQAYIRACKAQGKDVTRMVIQVSHRITDNPTHRGHVERQVIRREIS